MATETNEVTLFLELAQEELSVLLRFMGIPRIWGFEPLNLSDEVVKVVARGLLARNLLIEQDQQITVLPQVTAILGSGAFSRYALMLQKVVGTGAPMHFWLYLAQGLTVSHVITSDDLHHFQTISDGRVLTVLLASFLEFSLKENVPQSSEQVSISLPVWQKAIEAIKAGKRTAARDILLKQGVPTLFANDIEAYTQLHLLAYSALDANDVPQVTGGLILTTSASHWLVFPQGDNMIALVQTPQGILDQIAELLPH